MVETYHNVISSGGFFMGSPGMNIQTPRGTINTPSTPDTYNSPISSYIEKTAYFKCWFNSKSFEHIGNDNEVPSLYDKIENVLYGKEWKKADSYNKEALKNNFTLPFLLNKKYQKEAITKFTKNNELYLGYYDPKTEMYIILKMGKL